MGKNILTALGIMGGGAVVFYILGFVVLKTFTNAINLEGMFPFTEEHYRDAGASFLLEMIRIPFFRPHIFVVYVGILYMLIPKKAKLYKEEALSSETKSTDSNSETPATAHFIRPQVLQIALLNLILVATGLYAFGYNDVQENPRFLDLITGTVMNVSGEQFSTEQTSLAFFTFVTPISIIFGLFVARFYARLKSGSQSFLYYKLSSLVYYIFLVGIPIAYGYHIYDWKLFPIKDGAKISEALAVSNSNRTFFRIWFLGQFNDKYLFFTKSAYDAPGIIDIIDRGKISHLNFNIKKWDSFRYEMEGIVTVSDDSSTKDDEELKELFKF